jgi:hypothetical protein
VPLLELTAPIPGGDLIRKSSHFPTNIDGIYQYRSFSYSIPPKPKMVKLTLSRSPPGSFRNLLKDIRAKRVFDYKILRLKAVQ